MSADAQGGDQVRRSRLPLLATPRPRYCSNAVGDQRHSEKAVCLLVAMPLRLLLCLHTNVATQMPEIGASLRLTDPRLLWWVTQPETNKQYL